MLCRMLELFLIEGAGDVDDIDHEGVLDVMVRTLRWCCASTDAICCHK